MDALNRKDLIINIDRDQIESIEQMEITNKSNRKTLNIKTSGTDSLKNLKQLKIQDSTISIIHSQLESLMIDYSFLSDNFSLKISSLKKLVINQSIFADSVTNAFNSLPLLEEIHMNFYSPDGLKKNPINDCKFIKFIDFKFSQIQAIDEDYFKGLSNLETLCVSYEQFNYATDKHPRFIWNILKPLSSLQVFKFSYDRFLRNLHDFVPNYIGGLDRENQFIESQFKRIPFSLFRLKNVVLLLEKPKDVETLVNELKNLEELEVKFESVKHWGVRYGLTIHKEDVLKLVEFETSYIDVMNTCSVSIANQRHGSTNLIDFMYSDLSIVRNNPSLKDLSFLQSLNINCFYIDKNIFENLVSLKLLELYSVRFYSSSLSDAFIRLANLESLTIFKCKIEVIDESRFDSLINLKTLELVKDQISSIKKNAFSKLTKLVRLNLFNNVFGNKNFEPIFDGLVNLKELILTDCRIRGIPGKFFKILNALKKQIYQIII